MEIIAFVMNAKQDFCYHVELTNRDDEKIKTQTISLSNQTSEE